jgi:hypothetical protein
LPGEPQRQRSVHPQQCRRACENDEKQEGLGGEDCPKGIEISDRREPQQVDQEVTGAPKQGQENDGDEDGGYNASPAHICLLLFGNRGLLAFVANRGGEPVSHEFTLSAAGRLFSVPNGTLVTHRRNDIALT